MSKIFAVANRGSIRQHKENISSCLRSAAALKSKQAGKRNHTYWDRKEKKETVLAK